MHEIAAKAPLLHLIKRKLRNTSVLMRLLHAILFRYFSYNSGKCKMEAINIKNLIK